MNATPGETPTGYRRLTLPSGLGMTVTLGCERCGALVGHPALHDEWHDGIERDRDQAASEARELRERFEQQP